MGEKAQGREQFFEIRFKKKARQKELKKRRFRLNAPF